MRSRNGSAICLPFLNSNHPRDHPDRAQPGVEHAPQSSCRVVTAPARHRGGVVVPAVRIPNPSSGTHGVNSHSARAVLTFNACVNTAMLQL